MSEPTLPGDDGPAESVPLVPGVRLGRQVAGRPGVWSARRPDGAVVEVAVLSVPLDPAIRSAVFAALGPLVGAGAGHTQRVVDRTGCPDGVALVTEPLVGAAAAGIRRLSAGQLVTLGAPIARELDAFHRSGLAWGARRDEFGAEVFITAEGRPMLAVRPWAARRIDGSEVAGPATDVAEFVAFLESHAARFDASTARRWERVRSAADARALAVALHRVARPRPLPGPPTAGPHGAARPRARRSRLRAPVPRTLHRALPSLALAGAVAVAAVLGWLSVSRPAAGRTVAATSAPTDWRVVVAALDATRAEAFAGRAPLTDVDVEGGPAYLRDTQVVADLRGRHLRADGWSPQVADVRELPGTSRPDQVTLEVTDTLPAYVLVAAEGAVEGAAEVATAPATVPGRGRKVWHVELQRTPAGWRVASVTEV